MRGALGSGKEWSVMGKGWARWGCEGLMNGGEERGEV